MTNEVRYSVVTVENGIPQPRKEFHAVQAAAEFIAVKHMGGGIVKCLTNALTETVNSQRLAGIENRVNEILAEKGYNGQLWHS